MNRFISESFVTERLMVCEATVDDENVLRSVCSSWSEKKRIEGEEFADDYIKTCIISGDLPPVPNATKDNYRLKKVSLKETGKIIGFFDLYYGYPSPDSIYISILLLDSKTQRSGYGKEIVAQLIMEAQTTLYERIALGVQLKNWKALKFWINQGFKGIIGYYGDAILTDENFAMLGLEIKLK